MSKTHHLWKTDSWCSSGWSCSNLAVPGDSNTISCGSYILPNVELFGPR
ncbi:hypothetical protein GBAR_LOCUS25123, partial [Geodia barretti]